MILIVLNEYFINNHTSMNIMCNIDKKINGIIYVYTNNKNYEQITKKILNEHTFDAIWIINFRYGSIISDIDFLISKKIYIIFTAWDFFCMKQNTKNIIKKYIQTHKDYFFISEVASYEEYCRYNNLIKKENYIELSHYADDIFIESKHNASPLNKIGILGKIDDKYYKKRREITNLLKKDFPNDVEIVGYNNTRNNINNRLQLFSNEICKYKCCVTTSILNSHCLLAKFFEIPACGSLLLMPQELMNEANLHGFIDMQNCIMYNGTNIHEKVKFILNDENNEIIDNIRISGKNFIKNKYTKENFLKSIVYSFKKFMNIELEYIE
jgi:hypothetical protein